MKPRRNQPTQKKSGGGTLIGMFIGLVIGVVVAAGVVWYMNKAPLPFVQKSPGKADEAALAQNTPSTQHAEENKPVAGKVNTPPKTPAEPMPLPGKPGDPIPEKRFQFYDILPGKSEPKPDKGAQAPAAKDSKDVKPDDGKESKQPLFLQTGAFTTPSEADNQKAKLAFMGVEAVIHQVMVQDKTWYRVRVGPFNRVDELNKVRAELAKAGIDAQLAKNKE